MWKHLLIMVVILAGLVIWDRTLTQLVERARAEGVRIERLFDPEKVFTRPIAALRLVRGDGAIYHYVRIEGVWRCVEAHGAVALDDQVLTLFNMIGGPDFPLTFSPPRGVVQTRDPNAARDFGFDIDEMLTLAVCGPDMMDDPHGDVIYAFDIGRSIEATGGTYVRPFGSDDIWAVNADFRKVLRFEQDSLVPPMLDPHIVPAAWPGFRPPGVDRIVIEVPDQPPLELQRVERELNDEAIEAGEEPFQWTVKRGDRTYSGDAFQVFSYGGFLLRAPYAGLLGPHDPRQLGFDQPRGAVTLRSAHGMIMQLIIGQRAPRGGVPVFNTFSGSLYEVPPDIIEMMLPEMDMLLFDHLGNPWEPFIRR